MGDVRGRRGVDDDLHRRAHGHDPRENLHLLAVLLKQRRIDDLRVTAFSDDDHEVKEWVIYAEIGKHLATLDLHQMRPQPIYASFEEDSTLD